MQAPPLAERPVELDPAVDAMEVSSAPLGGPAGLCSVGHTSGYGGSR